VCLRYFAIFASRFSIFIQVICTQQADFCLQLSNFGFILISVVSVCIRFGHLFITLYVKASLSIVSTQALATDNMYYGAIALMKGLYLLTLS